ncbi:MAG: DNA primase [Clostridia bacterium]|nr:DNA primase [Clostridia bacterium]
MPRFSDETIREIRFRNNIEDVISQYVQLKRAGSNSVGLCPFHSEKSPSFTVFSKSDSFYCFGCGAGGDVISFIRRAEALDYPEAIEFLAKRAGITVVQNEYDKETAKRRERILQMNKEAARFFHNCLFDEKLGKEGLRYLTEERGLSLTTIRYFGLGFAPDSFNMLTDHLKRLGYADYELSTAFLAGISPKNNRPYDYFRNRVIFPIISTSGDIIAFGGRVMDDSKPKYLNTSDTPVFKKSRNLFALNYAKKSCEEQLVLCEGYMDVIALHAAGFTNAVATLGTAITSEHARLMTRYTKSVVISYDSDEAGQNAANKAFIQLGAVGLEARVLQMSGAKDPDEYIKKFGKDRFAELLKATKSEFEFKFDAVLSKYDINTTDGRVKALDEAIRILSSVSSRSLRDVYIGIVATRLSVTADSLKFDVERRIKKNDGLNKRKESERMIAASQGYGDRVNPDFAKNPKAASAEEQILGILLIHPEYLREMKNRNIVLLPEDFFTEFSRKIFTSMVSFESEFDISLLGESLTVEEVDRLQKLRMHREELSDNKIETLTALIGVLKDSAGKKELTLEELIASKRKKIKKDET